VLHPQGHVKDNNGNYNLVMRSLRTANCWPPGVTTNGSGVGVGYGRRSCGSRDTTAGGTRGLRTDGKRLVSGATTLPRSSRACSRGVRRPSGVNAPRMPRTATIWDGQQPTGCGVPTLCQSASAVQQGANSSETFGPAGTRLSVAQAIKDLDDADFNVRKPPLPPSAGSIGACGRNWNRYWRNRRRPCGGGWGRCWRIRSTPPPRTSCGEASRSRTGVDRHGAALLEVLGKGRDTADQTLDSRAAAERLRGNRRGVEANSASWRSAQFGVNACCLRPVSRLRACPRSVLRSNLMIRTWLGLRVPSRNHRTRLRRARVEPLEDRLAPATITVTDTGDTIALDGNVTLREPSPRSPGRTRMSMSRRWSCGINDTIKFNIPGAGPHTITLDTALPDISPADHHRRLHAGAEREQPPRTPGQRQRAVLKIVWRQPIPSAVPPG
jgi:hypothetical protein